MLKKQSGSFSPSPSLLAEHSGTVRPWAGALGDWQFIQKDLEKMAKSKQPQSSSFADWTTLSNKSHFVQFYENEDFLIQSVFKYIQTGDVAVIIVTPEHRVLLERMIEKKASLRIDSQRKYVFLDAKATLDQFMVNGVPDLELFDSIIGKLMRRLAKKHKNIRAYGEMVAVLWKNGNQASAIRLEELWNNLQRNSQFSLFCAYPMNDLGGEDSIDAFSRICTTHSNVLPNESFSKLETTEDQLREIALLQQKAKALEEEVKKHKITEIKLSDTMRALKANEEFNRGIIENSADCIKVLDLDGNLLSMNSPGCTMFEIDDLSPYVGQDYRQFWKDEYLDPATQAIEKARQGLIGRFQGFCPTAKGTPKWWDVVITPIYNEFGKIGQLLAISRDITAIKELEQRKEDFLNSTSHELKTPLTSQKAYIQLLERELSKNKDLKYKRYVEKIDEQTHKLEKLVIDLLEVSKIQNGKITINKNPFDLNHCIKNAIEEVAPTSNYHIINLKGKAEKHIEGDEEKVSQVILNLLTNALKYSPQANTVNVMIKNEQDRCVVSVQDFGIGIDKHDHQKVFERFFRGNDINEKTYPGLGLGLYIVSQIIEQHNGKIWFNSEKGKGSTFSFTLNFNK